MISFNFETSCQKEFLFPVNLKKTCLALAVGPLVQAPYVREIMRTLNLSTKSRDDEELEQNVLSGGQNQPWSMNEDVFGSSGLSKFNREKK